MHQLLWVDLEDQRQQRRNAIVASLRATGGIQFEFNNWSRVVSAKYGSTPLSAAGSLTVWGGRYNTGVDISTVDPFPALYLGENYHTAYREKWQLEAGGLGVGSGLTPEEMSLSDHQSFNYLTMRGRLHHVFDARTVDAFIPFSRAIADIKQPKAVRELAKALGLNRDDFMIRTPERLLEALGENWTAWAAQFDSPAPSQIFARMLIAAGFEGILYKSTKNPGNDCLAVFPHMIEHADSFVELHEVLDYVEHPRLDRTTAKHLCGWDLLEAIRRRSEQ
ncbi:MAG: RES family NAD+ phosphorylase [Xanthomonadales bacterium]|nr:RES family NAD+ phosphorylase [Xanthomonadales bacterium]